MDDYVKLQNCYSVLVSTNALNRINNRIICEEFNLSEESAHRHIQYHRNPLHYIVTSQVSNKKLWKVFQTIIKNNNSVRHRDQVYGRYPIHYIAASLHYGIRNIDYNTSFLIELGRISYCGFNEKDDIYSKSVKDYICSTNINLTAVMKQMYNKLAYKIQKMYKIKKKYWVIKNIEILPPNGNFRGGIEFQKLEEKFYDWGEERLGLAASQRPMMNSPV